MLSRLYIKNIALISEVNVEFDRGLNVLSGETGAGKSVILDSVNFVLGSKADKTMIRYGETEAFVKAEFTVSADSEAVKKLEEYDIECDGDIIISRKFSLDGRGSIKINGNAVTAAMLKSVTNHLVDVHGQSEHFFLLEEVNQLKVLDSLLGEKAQEIKNRLSAEISAKSNLCLEIAKLGGSAEERERKIDLLSYQIKEIESAYIKEGEIEELKSKQLIINNAEKILVSLNSIKEIIDGENGCGDGISSACHLINHISYMGEDYTNLSVRLETLSADVYDISRSISDLADNLSFDENEAQQIEDRLTLLKNLQKKYGVDERAILDFLQKAKTEFEDIKNSSELIEKYQRQVDKSNDKIYALCQELTEMRKIAAKNFCNAVIDELKTLNIANADFSVTFNEYDRTTANLQSENGSDKVSFEFSANKGEPLKPLNKVISGGEMSRFMLAVKTQLKDVNGISTYIFDEIDAGISGFTAGTVAGKFKDIAEHTQILAVSHLPQVCAASDAQFLIYKTEKDDKTYTNIKRLDLNEKIDEIVRLTGNVYSDNAKRHAEELINQFKN